MTGSVFTVAGVSGRFAFGRLGVGLIAGSDVTGAGFACAAGGTIYYATRPPAATMVPVTGSY